jgi:hypothetical protein
MKSLEIDVKTGIVQYPHLHDSTILSVTFEGKSVCIKLKTIAANVVHLILADIRGLSIESLFENNIVFEVAVCSVSEGTHEDFVRVFHKNEYPVFDNDYLKKLKSESLIFLRINPTLGADVLALCRNATWQEKFEPTGQPIARR